MPDSATLATADPPLGRVDTAPLPGPWSGPDRHIAEGGLSHHGGSVAIGHAVRMTDTEIAPTPDHRLPARDGDGDVGPEKAAGVGADRGVAVTLERLS